MKIDKGIYKDTNAVNQPTGTARHILNGNLSKVRGSVTADKGMSLFTTLPENSVIVGHVKINDNEQVVFVKDIGCKIYLLSDKTYYLLLSNSFLNFNVEYSIYGSFIVNSKNETIVLWTDNYNPPRFLNISNIPTISNINELNIFPVLEKAAFVDSVQLNSDGGNLNTGAIYIGLAYVDKTGTETTVFHLSPAIYIYDEDDSLDDTKIDGCDGGIPTSKSITLTISNIDSNYEFIRLFAIHRENSVELAPRQIKDIKIVGASMTINYSGTESYITRTRDEITVAKAFYEKVKHIKKYGDTFYMANCEGRIDIGAQKYVNNIKVDAVFGSTSIDMFSKQGSYKSPTISFKHKSFMYDEVYALYISFILNDGSRSFAYHIPGRTAQNITGVSGILENSLVSDWAAASGTTINTYGGADVVAVAGNDGKIFQCIDTSLLATGNTRGMSYWENEDEVYPNTDDFDVYQVINGVGQYAGSIKNQKVRHHKMPSLRESGQQLVNSDMQTAEILTISLSDIRLPNTLLSKVIGYEIYHAKRDFTNSRVVAQGTFTFMCNGYVTPAGAFNDYYHMGMNKLPTSAINPTSFLYSGLRFISFDALALNFSPQIVDYLKIDRQVSTTINSLVVNSNPTRLIGHVDARGGSCPVPTTVDAIIKKVSAAAYLPANSKVAGTPFGNVISNEQSEKALALLTTTNFPNGAYSAGFTSLTDLDNAAFNMPIATLYSNRKNVYQAFQTQELVFTGYTANKNDLGLPSFITLDGGGDTYKAYFSHISTAYYQRLSGNPIVNKILYTLPYMSVTNPLMREAGQDSTTEYYPKISNGSYINSVGLDPDIPQYLLQEGLIDNYIKYNKDFNALQNIKTSVPQPIDFVSSYKFPTRIQKSLPYNQESSIDNFRIFLIGDAEDLPKDNGDITGLSVHADKLVIHFERGVRISYTDQSLQTDQGEVAIKSQDIFSIPPKELITSDYGYGGCQNIASAVSTPYGLFYVDRDAGKVFLITDNPEEISSYGMYNFFYIATRGSLLSVIEDNDGYYAYKDSLSDLQKGIGVHAAYDAEFKRVLFTFRDYKFINPSLFWGEDTTLALGKGTYGVGNIITKNGELFVVVPSDGIYDVNLLQTSSLKGKRILLTDTNYFTPNHFTIAYYPELKVWGSFHSMYPYHMIWTNNKLLSIQSGTSIYKHNSGNTLSYYGVVQPFIIELVLNEQGNEVTRLQSVELNTEVLNNDTEELETFNEFVAYTHKQSTGLQTLTLNDTFRYVNRKWRFNNLRDIYIKGTNMFEVTNDFVGLFKLRTLSYDTATRWYKKMFLVDKFFIIRLVYNKASPKELTFHNIEVNQLIDER